MHRGLDSRNIVEGLIVNNGVDFVKDTAPYVAMGTGSTLTLSPALILQITGVCVGVAGAVVAVLRWKEAKRANDINEKRLEYEIAESKNSAKDITPQHQDSRKEADEQET